MPRGDYGSQFVALGCAVRGVKQALALAVLLMLGGCVPAPYGPYYKPSYPDSSATLIKEGCHGDAGPPSVLRFNVDGGIAITVSTTKSYTQRHSKEVPLNISLKVPPGHEVRFLSDEFRISGRPDAEGDKVNASFNVISSVQIGSEAAVDLDQIGPVPADAVRLWQRDNPDKPAGEARIYMRTPGVGNFMPEAMVVHMPAIEAAGQSIDFPRMKMSADTLEKNWWRYRTLENRRDQQERYARCLKDTPHLHCKNILEVYIDGFRVRQDGFELSGGLGVVGYAGPKELTGEFDFRFNRHDPWRFSGNEIGFVDLKKGEVRHYVFKDLYLLFGWYAVPFTTPVYSRAADLKADTTIRIESSLGEQHLSRYYIHLPPMLVDGRKVDFEPLVLELRLFDGGLEPFNC